MTNKILWLTGLSATLGSIASGTFFGWTSPAFSLYKNANGTSSMKLDAIEESRITALLLIGIGFGCLILAISANKIGRKLTMLIGVIPSFLSWLIIAYATNPWHLYVSRTIAGLGIATAYSTLPMYIGEISPVNIRGLLLSGLRIAGKIGILIEFSCAPFLSIKTGALLSTIFPILFVLTLIWLPESPYYLIRQRHHGKAKKSLVKFLDKDDVNDELTSIENSISSTDRDSVGIKDILLKPTNRKALFIPVMLSLIQQFSGTQAITSYAQGIFETGNPVLKAEYLTIIFGIVTVLATVICTLLVDRMGRRPLLITSTIGCFLTTLFVAIYYHLLNNKVIDSTDWLPATGIILNTAMWSIGLAALPLAIMAEIFPISIKTIGCSIVVVFASFSCAFVAYLHKIVHNTFGLYTIFYIYALSSALGTFYIYFYVPETKGKTLQQIQDEINTVKK